MPDSSQVTSPQGSKPEMAAVLKAYELACSAHESLQEFRGKILGFLPLASGTGIFLLVDSDVVWGHFTEVAAFGFLATLGLLLYEIGLQADCVDLLLSARALEKKLELGTVCGTSTATISTKSLAFWAPILAAWVVYGAVLLAWSYLAYYECRTGILAFLPAGLVLSVGGLLYGIRARGWWQDLRKL